MRVLAIHNYYQQRGGEDQCFEDEVRVLKAHGHEVETYTVHNDSIDGQSKFKVALGTIWNRSASRHIERLIERFQPNIVHAMNTFPLLSYSVLRAAHRMSVAVVQEVQNYRFACAGAFFMREGQVCEACSRTAFPLAAVKHRCYRGSVLGSATLATSIAIHRRRKSWIRYVDLFLCPSGITKRKLAEFGIEPERIHIKPNVLDIDPGIEANKKLDFVFVGRLSPEKGLSTLLEAWRRDPSLPTLKIIGDGPLADEVKRVARDDGRIEASGKLPLSRLLEIVGQARFLVMPSVWYETFGRTTVEAFAKGTPVVGSRIGGTAEIIVPGETGFLFEPGNVNSLLAELHKALGLSDEAYQAMQMASRRTFEANYTSQANYDGLMIAYEHAIRISEQHHAAK